MYMYIYIYIQIVHYIYIYIGMSCGCGARVHIASRKFGRGGKKKERAVRDGGLAHGGEGQQQKTHVIDNKVCCSQISDHKT